MAEPLESRKEHKSPSGLRSDEQVEVPEESVGLSANATEALLRSVDALLQPGISQEALRTARQCARELDGGLD